MKKKLLTGILLIFLSVAMIGAATMAWFTDSDNAGEALFTAGTVDIEAGDSAVLSQYFDPSTAVYLYGVEAVTGDLYEIDVKNKTTNRFYDADMSNYGNADGYSPNGLAFDNRNKRLYFSIVNGSSSALWFYDLKNKVVVRASATNERSTIYGAAFYDGYYWYMANNTDVLYRVGFNPDGTVKTSELVSHITGDPSKSFGFGDVVMDIKDGILYGSSTSGIFFKYDITKGTYEEIARNVISLQLAFGSDGLLYGQNTDSKKWYTVDSATGSIQNFFTGDKKFNDLASGSVSVWNPGDTDRMKYFVRNVGTKKIRVRARLEGQWNDSALSNSVVAISLSEGSNWFVGSGGYFYYNGILEPGASAELCVQIQLSGPNTGNAYQGKTYTLSGFMDAIQSSNDAPLINWGEDFIP